MEGEVDTIVRPAMMERPMLDRPVLKERSMIRRKVRDEG
jgi:hypothetical protein